MQRTPHDEQPIEKPAAAPATAEPAPEPPRHPAVCGQLEFIRGNYRLVETRDLVL